VHIINFLLSIIINNSLYTADLS